MNYNLENNTLTIYLKGDLNSNNANDIEKELFSIIEKNTFTNLILDLKDLRYISSAGLRVVLRVKQKSSSLEIINVSLEVYDVFEMTGFTSMMNIKKALKEVDVSNATLIGEGYFSYVYRLDKDTIIKVFKFATDTKEIEREREMAKQAFILGIPTAISFDIVKVGDKFGVRFEMLDSKSLRDIFLEHPQDFDFYANEYGHLIKKIGETESMSNDLPKTKEVWLNKLEVDKPYLDDEEYQKSLDFINSIPDVNTFVHGDCHIKNVMVRDKELFLIDMDTLSQGHPIFELASIYAPYVAFEEDDPGNIRRFLGIENEMSYAIYDKAVSITLGDLDSDLMRDKIKILAYIHMVWWNRMNEPQNEKRLNGCLGRLKDLLKKYKELKF